MNFDPLINWFIHSDYVTNHKDLRKARLLVSGCLLTSFFSTSYVLLSVVFSYEKGIYFTAFNVIGYFILPFLVRTRLPLLFLGNLYTVIGATTVIALTVFSGGMWSAIYPWIIAIPVLALLIAGRTSAVYWSIVSFLVMLVLGGLELQGIKLPVEYNTELRTLWFLSILPGLLLIIMVVSMTFEAGMQRALRDVEAQKETIEKQSAELEKLVDEKDNIIGILAHDLRNPLNNIGILVKMLKDETNEDEKKNLLEMIGRASSNAQVLVKDVLEMAALEQEGELIKLQAVPVMTMIYEVMESLQTAADSKDIRVNFNNNTESVTVLADPTYFRQVMENLISNAVKFSPAGKNVDVSVIDNENHIQIRVKDNGLGVPTNEEHKLFKKFSRLSPQPTAGESSSGLGLSLVKRYMELMNGSVEYVRPEDKGSIFVVEFLKADSVK